MVGAGPKGSTRTPLGARTCWIGRLAAQSPAPSSSHTTKARVFKFPALDSLHWLALDGERSTLRPDVIDFRSFQAPPNAKPLAAKMSWAVKQFGPKLLVKEGGKVVEKPTDEVKQLIDESVAWLHPLSPPHPPAPGC